MNKFLLRKCASSDTGLGFRGEAALEEINERLNENAPTITSEGLNIKVVPGKDPEAYEEALRDAFAMGADISSEELADRRGILDALDVRGASYGLSAGAGGLLGALLMKGGLKKRLIAALLGAGLGAGANYLRRKSYYGDHAKW